MALSKSAISFIGRFHPEIFDILGNPSGPYSRRGAEVSLNPQPLPPLADGLRIGYRVGGELVRTAHLAGQLGLTVAFDPDGTCGTVPRVPPVPPVSFPPIPWPRHSDEQFSIDYNLGIALALEASAMGWERLDAAGSLTAVHEAALKNLDTVERASFTEAIGRFSDAR